MISVAAAMIFALSLSLPVMPVRNPYRPVINSAREGPQTGAEKQRS